MLEKDVSSIEFSPEKLELALEEKKISQAELSDALGFTHRNTINKIIRRKRQASATDLLRIAIALNKNPQDFAKSA
jgi:transcriptional regulator with XRE-family HTH domain